MNLYEDLVAIKDSLGITGTSDDTKLLFYLEAASRIIDSETNRHFYIESETRYFDGASPLPIDDLLSITTIKIDEDGDGTFESTLTVTTDYLLYPLNKYPKTEIKLAISSGYGSFGNAKKGCEIDGLFGYGDGLSATPYIDSGDEVEDDGGISAVDDLIDVTDADNLSPGQTVLIESEQCYISGFDTSGNTITVTRGVNGTTAATHAKDTTIYIYDYPKDIEQSCLSLAEKLFVIRGKGFQSERLGDYSYTMVTPGIPEPERTLISALRKVRI